jgi:hypothetical protein
MFENLALRGLLSVIGAFFISLSVGVAFLWGIITIYATSYFRIVMKDDTLTEQLTDIVFPLTLLGQVIPSPFRPFQCHS